MARGVSVKEMLATTDSQELTEAMAYARVEPWGEWRADLRAAVICHTLYRLLSDSKAPKAKVEDWMPDFEPATELTPEDFVAKLLGMAAAAGGEIRR
jgi:hypothetical protein